MRSISEILDGRAIASESRFTALFTELDNITREVRALPRILSEMLAERGTGSRSSRAAHRRAPG